MLKSDELPAPDAPVAYPDGSFAPAMFHYAAEDTDAVALARSNGFDLTQLEMPDDHPLRERSANGDNVIGEWTPPEELGWTLCGKHEGEDGPVATYLRKRPD